MALTILHQALLHKCDIYASEKGMNQIKGSAVGRGMVVRWMWVNFQFRGVLIICNKVGQGPTALAVVRLGVDWTFFSRLLFFFFLSLSGKWPDLD